MGPVQPKPSGKKPAKQELLDLELRLIDISPGHQGFALTDRYGRILVNQLSVRIDTSVGEATTATVVFLIDNDNIKVRTPETENQDAACSPRLWKNPGP